MVFLKCQLQLKTLESSHQAHWVSVPPIPLTQETPATAAAAAAKSLQSCLTLCDPIDGSPPGSSVHGIFQARVLEWGVIAFSRLQPRWPLNSWTVSSLYDLGVLNLSLFIPASFPSFMANLIYHLFREAFPDHLPQGHLPHCSLSPCPIWFHQSEINGFIYLILWYVVSSFPV